MTITALTFYTFVRRVGRTKTKVAEILRTHRWTAAEAEGRAAGPSNRYLGRRRCRAPCRRPAAIKKTKKKKKRENNK